MSIAGLQGAYVDCDQRLADLIIDEVVYRGASTTVIGFRAKKPGADKGITLFEMDTYELYRRLGRLPEYAGPGYAENRDVQKVIRKGQRVLVVYQMCRSGGEKHVRDVFQIDNRLHP
jgi:hypothetical protein